MKILKKLGLGAGAAIAMFLIFNNIEVNSPPVAFAQSCTVPTAVQNVAVAFPNCDNGTCLYTQGKCSWSTLTGATGYNVKVTAAGTSTTVLDQQAASSATSVAFSVETSDTYKCDVSAINSCGTGVAGTSSLLCKTDFVVTLTPTTAPVVVTSAPPATMPPAGNNTSVWLGFAGFIIILISFSLLLI